MDDGNAPARCVQCSNSRSSQPLKVGEINDLIQPLNLSHGLQFTMPDVSQKAGFQRCTPESRIKELLQKR